MKKLLFLFLVLDFLFSACKTSEDDIPLIEMVSLYVNGNETNYRDKIEDLPVLAIGDELTIDLRLTGKKIGLSRFVVQERKAISQEMNKEKESEVNLFSIDIEYSENEVSNALGKPEKGTFAFKDEVYKATVTVKVTIIAIAEEAAVLFYLSSKENGSNEATKMELNLQLSNNSIPTIEITELYLNNNNKNYNNNFKELPSLDSNDELDFKINLNGNGYNLTSFQVWEKDDKAMLSLEYTDYDRDVVSGFGNMGKGVLFFKNKVFRTTLALKAKVKTDTVAKAIISFDLFSEGGAAEGAKELIDLILVKSEK